MARCFSSREGQFATVDCSDWEDFRSAARTVLQEIAKSCTLSDRFVFRGQSCSRWGLEAVFDRENSNLSLVDRDQKYSEMMELFRVNYSVYGSLGQTADMARFPQFDTLGNEEVESLAQHFGLPTRLLDWSFSMYVAAFFAVSRTDLCETGKISVWSLDISAIKLCDGSKVSLSRDLYKGNVRNLWQMGAFTKNRTSNPDLVPVFRQADNPDQPLAASKSPTLIRFDIPVEAEMVIIDDLQMMRINSMTIFPGIEGVVGWIKRKVAGL